jgi:hypothetical protein
VHIPPRLGTIEQVPHTRHGLLKAPGNALGGRAPAQGLGLVRHRQERPPELGKLGAGECHALRDGHGVGLL